MKKKYKIIIVLLSCIFFTSTTTYAKNNIKSLFQAEENLKVKESLDGTSFFAGNKVTLESDIKGIGFIAGSDISISGNQEYIFSAGANINIEGSIKNDAFLAAETIKLKNTTIGRDAYMAASEIDLEGEFHRNIFIVAENAELKGTYNGNVTINSANISIDNDTIIKGTLKYNEDAKIDGTIKKYTNKTYKNKENKITLKNYLSSFISSYIHILMLALVIVFMFEKMLKNSLKQTKNLSAKNIIILCGKGLLILIGVPIIAITLLCTGLFTSVGLIGGLIYVILLSIANIFTSYFVATLLDKKYFKKDMNSYLLVIVGLFIIYILELIPILGGLITFISIILGLGILGNMIIELKD